MKLSSECVQLRDLHVRCLSSGRQVKIYKWMVGEVKVVFVKHLSTAWLVR